MKNFLIIALLGILYLPLAGQAPVYDDLNFETDSTTKAYKPSGKNYVYIKSKRGTSGVNKTSGGDSVKSMPITDIVLVFTETNPEAIANREEANRERWENLLKTYPEFFQFETNYKTVCQCNTNGDTAAFKKAQGFYVYIKGKEEPKPEPVKTEPKKEVADAGKSKAKEEKPRKEEKVKEEKPKEEKVSKKEKAPKEEKPAKETVAKKEEKAEEADDTPVASAPVRVSKPGKAGYAKPKKAKDPKACGLPCYEGGDEDLNIFFRDNIPLSKKQRRHSGDLEAVLKLQLNFDGSIKKTFVTGENTDFNKMVEDAVKKMNNWNPAVKGGITVKSEVKMTLKYDSGTKAIKPFETTIIPRPGPKCTCMTESDLAD